MEIQLADFLECSDPRSFEVDAELFRGEVMPDKWIGLYADLGQQRLGLFLVGANFYLWWEGQAIPVSPEIIIHHHVWEGALRHLEIRQKGLLIEASYEVSPPIITQFYAESDDDTDFGLWVKSVLTCEETNALVRKSWSQRSGSDP
ncbi:hypothetical protein [Bremerella sp. P1]|uniref:hypothetical protein n=1 Tax=Bremerella sp. P1 TaxID=3026424 RepID=UPI002368755E|nr:hypothetical protein [Bremerella sp. P1]WDI43597.1 hypothetical protein PSR63_06520 [Bremerella sp. P1]